MSTAEWARAKREAEKFVITALATRLQHLGIEFDAEDPEEIANAFDGCTVLPDVVLDGVGITPDEWRAVMLLPQGYFVKTAVLERLMANQHEMEEHPVTWDEILGG